MRLYLPGSGDLFLLRMCGCSPLQLPRQHAGDHQTLRTSLLMCYSHKDTRSPQVFYSRQPTRRTDTGASHSGTGAVHNSSIKNKKKQQQKPKTG